MGCHINDSCPSMRKSILSLKLHYLGRAFDPKVTKTRKCYKFGGERCVISHSSLASDLLSIFSGISPRETVREEKTHWQEMSTVLDSQDSKQSEINCTSTKAGPSMRLRWLPVEEAIPGLHHSTSSHSMNSKGKKGAERKRNHRREESGGIERLWAPFI